MAPDDGIIDVFLCHTGANKDWTRELAARLETERVEERPLRVFFDEWDIAQGENILARIEDGLRRARFFTVVLSPALTRASWPTMEWQTQVHDDPSGRRGRILPLLLQKFDSATLEPLDIPLPLRLLRYFDFSDRSHLEGEYQQLLARIQGHRPQRGRPTLGQVAGPIGIVTGPETADSVEEVLLGNLFPVTELPPFVYSDATPAQRYGEVRNTISGPLRPPFVLHSNRLYSFVPPDTLGNPFRVHLAGTDPGAETTEDWLADPALTTRLVWLCNDAVRDRCYNLRLRSPRGQRGQFYPPCEDGQRRSFTWGSGRTVTLAKVSEKNARRLGVHHSARMRFIALGGRLHLLIEPGWFFTADGLTPIEGRQVGVFSVRWGGRESNDTVLRHTLMWARLLASGQVGVTLPVGGEVPIRVAPLPVYGRVNLGIYGDTTALDRILEGEGAGEVGTGLGDEELDQVAAAHEQGLIPEDGERAADADSDEVRGDDGESSAPELPL